MKKDKIKIYGLELILGIILLFALFVSTNISRFLIAAFLLIYMVLLKKIIKKERGISIYHKQVCILVFILSIIYVLLFYSTGIYFGFTKTYHTLTFKSLITFIIPVSITIILCEKIRFILLSQDDKKQELLTIINMVLIDLIIYKNIYDASTLNGFLAQMGFVLFASIATNILYNYLAKNYGYKPSMIYHLITILYSYIIPVIPNVYIFFRTLFRIIYPYFIYFVLEYAYSKQNSIASYKDKRKNAVQTGIMITVTTFIVCLISCRFRYGILVIGSGSMTGTINKGDAVIFQQYKKQQIKEGTIIIYEKDNTTTVHRIVNYSNVNGTIRYYTKGDANKDRDNGYITSSSIKGIVLFKIPYIGNPTLWLRESFKK